ncbi:DUF3027 domain-containing protein [Streptomyces melanogenes]|uniref:DUF3027 domain-containing protein n=1 Tax=Streptomyces melanogenes TaxID=67326 RepID=UPI00379CFF8F
MRGAGEPWTGDDRSHNDFCHARWRRLQNRSTTQADYREAWYDAQCGGCRFWVALRGEIGLDYGACTGPSSPFDGRVRFEHDGCECFAARGDGWFG